MTGGVAVPLFSSAGATCELVARRSRFVITRPGKTDVHVVTNGLWHPAMPAVEPGYHVPRGWSVLRTKRAQMNPPALVGDGNLTDGAYQGGTDIVLDPFGQPYSKDVLARADLTMQRHAIAAHDWVTGQPLHPDLFGDVEYLLDQDFAADLNGERATQLPPFRKATPLTHKMALARRIAASHLVRAFWRDVLAWAKEQDIPALMRLIAQAYDVMRSYRHVPIGKPGEGFKLSLAQMLLNVTANPNRGNMGIIRWFAHCIRVVAEVRIALGEITDANREACDLMDSWLRMVITTVHRGQCLNGAWGDNHFGEQHEQEQPWVVPQPGGYPLLGLRDGEMPSFQGPYMFCAIARAAEALGEDHFTDLARECLTRYLEIYRWCAREPGKWSAGVTGLPYWIRTSIDGALLERCDKGGIGKSDTTWEPDVARVAEAWGLEVPVYSIAKARAARGAKRSPARKVTAARSRRRAA